MASHMPVNDMIAETSATKNSLSRDSLIIGQVRVLQAVAKCDFEVK